MYNNVFFFHKKKALLYIRLASRSNAKMEGGAKEAVGNETSFQNCFDRAKQCCPNEYIYGEIRMIMIHSVSFSMHASAL